MKTVRACVATALMAALLTGCGTSTNGAASAGETSGADTVVLDVWYQSDNPSSAFNSKMEEAVSQYEQAHSGVKLELHSLDSASYKEKLATDFTGKAKDIDVFYDWAPAKLTQLVRADRVLPLDDYISAEKLGEIKEGSEKSFVVDGKLYGLPMNSSMMLLYCNRGLFKKAGAKLPATWDELLAAGEKLKAAGVRPLAVGAGDSWLAGALYENLAVREVGAEKCSAVLSGEASMLDDPGFRTAAEKMNELYQDGILGDNPLQVTDTDALADFIDGKAGMLLDGSWAASSIDNSSDRAAADVVPIIFPLAEAGKYASDYIGGTSVSFFVNKNTDAPDEAADVALYLAEWFGRASSEMGLGFSCWNDLPDDLPPTFAAAQKLYDQAGENVRSWDTVLDTAAAKTHLEACQALLADEPDIDGFLKAHDAALYAQK
jgi:raffinose/stachyose/melibiose transport system substrate-binding protein